MDRRRLSQLASVNAALCLAAGIVYLFTSSDDIPVTVPTFLATLSLLGALALAGAGLWQQRAARGELSLIMLALIAAGFTAASGLGLAIVRSEQPPLDLATTRQIVHGLGIAAGISLFTATIGQLIRESGPEENATTQ
jgi:hypothetical protein